MKSSVLGHVVLVCAVALGASCKNDSDVDANMQEEDATLAVKTYLSGELDKLAVNAKAIEAAAPAPDADGWNDKDDEAAVDQMKAAWSKTRDEYEHIEGAIAVLFPGLDVSTDERYDAFVEMGKDDNLFDDEGATGMHSIERILWTGHHPARVVKFESALPNYVAAAFPANETEARDFKEKLCAKLVKDVDKMQHDFGPLALDAATAFRGVVGSMQEQVEKITLAATAEDESRYAQRTLEDMRANLEGGRKVYAAFRDWTAQDGGDELDQKIVDRFEQISKAYAATPGVAIPEVPAGFDPDKPTAAQLKTPYGVLWSLLAAETDVKDEDSLVSAMLDAADAMSIPQLPQ